MPLPRGCVVSIDAGGPSDALIRMSTNGSPERRDRRAPRFPPRKERARTLYPDALNWGFTLYKTMSCDCFSQWRHGSVDAIRLCAGRGRPYRAIARQVVISHRLLHDHTSCAGQPSAKFPDPDATSGQGTTYYASVESRARRSADSSAARSGGSIGCSERRGNAAGIAALERSRAKASAIILSASWVLPQI